MPVAPNPLAVTAIRAKTPIRSELATGPDPRVTPPSGSRVRGWSDVPEALRDRAMFSARVENLRLLQSFQDRLAQSIGILRRPGMGKDGGEGAYQTRERFIAEHQAMGREFGLAPSDPGERGGLKDITSERRLGLIYDTQTKMAQGYARHRMGQDPDVLRAFPALEFVRVASRKAPRGDWKRRWIAAGGAVFGGRMIARVNDPVWRKLSRFGKPYAPFDFGSGMGTRKVARREAERLGVTAPGEEPPAGAVEDFNAGLEQSVADLRPEFQRQLKNIFQEQIEIEDGVAKWLPRSVAMQPMDRARLPAPLVEAGAGLALEPERATIEEAAALQLPHERGIVYDAQGNFLFARDAAKSNPFQTNFEPSDYPALRGTVVSHTHVNASGPSREDMRFTAHGSAELRIIATDAENKPILYRLRPPPEGWPRDMETRYVRAGNAVAPELETAVAQGQLSRAQADAQFEERILARMLAETPGLFQYERIDL